MEIMRMEIMRFVFGYLCPFLISLVMKNTIGGSHWDWVFPIMLFFLGFGFGIHIITPLDKYFSNGWHN